MQLINLKKIYINIHFNDSWDEGEDSTLSLSLDFKKDSEQNNRNKHHLVTWNFLFCLNWVGSELLHFQRG